jgi:DNA polymerase III alpha subunit
MAEKTRTNEHGDVTFSEEDAMELLYTDPDFDISRLFFDDTDKYDSALKKLGLDLTEIRRTPNREPLAEFDNRNINDWHMPASYQKINVLEWLLERCHNDEERMRVQLEYDLFEKKKFIKVLQFMIYFVDTLRANNIVWGVGRGSSVSSFCLFLIGVHKINPMLYNLDITEFLR